MALWSERQGQRRGLGKVDFRNALFEVLHQLMEQNIFTDAGGEADFGWGGFIADPERWACDELKDSKLWPYLSRPWTVYEEWDPDYATDPKPKQWKFNVLFDIVEALHRDVASLPGEDEHDYDREGGQRVFRDAVNPVLAQLEPPKVLTEDGRLMDVVPARHEAKPRGRECAPGRATSAGSIRLSNA